MERQLPDLPGRWLTFPAIPGGTEWIIRTHLRRSNAQELASRLKLTFNDWLLLVAP